MQQAVGGLLAAYGEIKSKEQRRFQKLAKLGNEELTRRYWTLETQGAANEQEVLAYAQKCLRFGRQVALQAQKQIAGRYCPEE